MSTLYETLCKKQQLGVTFLDKHVPGWYTKFGKAELDRLVIDEPEACVLTVATGLSFWDAIEDFGIPYHKIAEFGFATFTNDYDAPEILSALWCKSILKSQKKITSFDSVFIARLKLLLASVKIFFKKYNNATMHI